MESLRYLELSNTPIAELPDINNVTELQILRINKCSELDMLDTDMSKLINLRHLEFDFLRGPFSMPIGLGKLTKLQTLNAFRVGFEDGTPVGELMNLNELRGSFSITQLENVSTEEDAKRASLHTKKNIKKLCLQWESSRGTEGRDRKLDERVLECLGPYFSLKELLIVNYDGEIFPSWISSPSFSCVVDISLIGCIFCSSLPPLGQLPTLKYLGIADMKELTDIDSLFCRKSSSDDDHAFRKLERLQLGAMSSLESWTGVEKGDFPSLLKLEINNCQRLVTLPGLSSMESLKNIDIRNCPVVSCRVLEDLPRNLEKLSVNDCPKLKEWFDKDMAKSNIATDVDEMYVDYETIPTD